ncbi:ABC transporter permease [Lysinibacter sp. HNR]|uniref:ABC transporter permease n=1 Tax=Lysinibacter sp. HNR TaxID=3031408 RepID=UPI002434D431|nr:ABC transporter permease [Lysinibacter sp. HNR]WGD37789.1 ABC transporter permease [Lysinibacter sp. HNR]
MFKYLTKRLGYYIALIFIGTSLAYILASAAMNPRGNFEQRNPRPPQSSIEATLTNLGVNDNDPLFVRYFAWLGKVLQGDFGQTINNLSVNAQFAERVGSSLQLLLLGSILGILLGVLIGVWNALRQYKLSDRTVSALSFLVMSMPVFILAILLKMGATWLNTVTGTQLINFTGSSTPGLVGGFWTHLWDTLNHLLLPTIAIALGGIAFYSRYQRATMLDTLGADYLRTARAKGLTRSKATFRHALRMAIIPMTTLFSFGMIGVITGATMTEQIYGWNGLGKWFIDSVNSNDINSVTAYCAFAAVIVLLSGFLADVLHATLDPRVRV